MSLSHWAVRHDHHDVVGPRLCMSGTVLRGVEVRASRDHGLIDLRLLFTNTDGSYAVPACSDWITQYGQYDRTAEITFDATSERAVGIEVRERHGSGIVDFRLILRARANDGERVTLWALNDNDVSETAEIRVEEGSEVRGIQAKERAGEGIVDLQLIG